MNQAIVPQPTAIAYARWSTPEQGEFDSQKRQEDAIAAYCMEKGILLMDITIDEGVSAFRSKNARGKGKLAALMDDLKNKRLKVNYVLVESFDRLSRDAPWDARQLITEILNTGVAIVTLIDRQVYSRKTMRENSTLSILMDVILMRAQDESIHKTARSKGAWTSKRENASNKVMTARGPAWLDPILETIHTSKGPKAICVGFTVNEEKAKVVRGIYKMAAQGKSLDGIAKALNDLDVKPITVSKKGSKFWYRQQVLRFLQAKSVIGTHEPWTATYERDEDDVMQTIKTKLDDIPNYYPPIVDEELARKVWALGKTRSSFKGTGRAALITSGITKCDKCGNTMSYNIKGKYRYIVCSNRRFNGCSNKKLWVYGEVESVLLNELVEVLDHHSLKAEDSQVTDLKGAMEEIELEIGRLMDAIRYRGFDASVGAALNDLEAQRKAMRLEMTEASQRASKSFLTDAIEELKASILNGDTVPEINQNMRLVFKSLILHDNKLPTGDKIGQSGQPPYLELVFADGSRAFMPLIDP